MDVQVFRIPDSWTDSLVNETVYLTIRPFGIDDSVYVFSANQITGLTIPLATFPANGSNQFESFQFNYVSGQSDSIFVRLKSGKTAGYSVYRMPVVRSSAVDFSGAMTYKAFRGNELRKLPTNFFNPVKDSIYFDFRLLPRFSEKRDRFGYRLCMISSNSDTSFKIFQVVKDSGLTVFSGSIPLQTIKPGKYSIHTEILRNNAVAFKHASLPFFILTNPDERYRYEEKREMQTTGLFDGYTEVEIDQLFLQASLIASPDEMSLFNRLLNLENKKRFIDTFWRNRERDPINNFYSFSERMRYVEKKFRNGKTPGFQTDRGKIYLKYGPSDDVYVSTSRVDVKPFEVWYYPEVQGQSSVYFYFVDISGYGNYQLIHSTARDEVFNPYYLSRLGIDAINYREN